jgi:hypothetical protein
MLLLVALVAGCFTGNGPGRAPAPPFSTTTRLTKQQLNWYVQRAIAWMQVDYDVMPDGSKLTRAGFIFSSTIDHSRPIECVQSEDGNTVTVTIPQHIAQNSEYWMVVNFNTRTGEVRSYGGQMVSKSV